MRALLRAPSLTRELTWRRTRPLARSLPKAAPDFGTVEYTAAFNSWNTASVAVPAVTEDDFIVVGWGIDGLAYLYPIGLNVVLCTTLSLFHNGSVGSGALGLVRKRPDAAWPAALDLNTGSTAWRASAGARFRAGPGFRGEMTRQIRINGSGASFTMTPPTNPGPPGGLCVAVAYMDSGGAGPNGSVSGAGWVYVSVGGLIVMAMQILPTDRVLTPPAAVFTSSRSDAWMGAVAYLR